MRELELGAHPVSESPAKREGDEQKKKKKKKGLKL